MQYFREEFNYNTADGKLVPSYSSKPFTGDRTPTEDFVSLMDNHPEGEYKNWVAEK